MSESDRIFPYFRWVSAGISLILLAAFRILYFFPDSTDRLFAWKISSHMTCYLIGAGYLGGAYFFATVAIFGHRLKWHEVRLAIIPVTAFTITMAIITIVHWEKFNNHLFAGQLWDALYFSLPFILPAILIHHQRQMPQERSGSDSTTEVSQGLKALYFAVGLFLFIYGCILFLFPSTIIPTWPWPLTVVTTMAIGGWIILPGVAGLSILVDSRRSAWQLLLQAQAFSVVFILLGMYLARDELKDILYTYVLIGALIFMEFMIAAILLQPWLSRRMLRPL
jgi:hypothetical protein